MYKKINIDGQNLKINFQSFGTGKKILLIHGLMHSSLVWNKTIEKLQKRYQIDIFDWPGFGKSSIPHIKNKGLDFLEKVLEKIIVDEYYAVIAHSMGAIITLKSFPKIKAEKFILCSPPVKGVNLVKPLFYSENIGKNLIESNQKLSKVNDTLLKLITLGTIKKWNYVTSDVIESINNSNPNFAAILFKEITNLNLNFKHIEGNFLIVRGKSEIIVLKKDLIRLSKQIGSEYIEITDSSHTYFVENTKEFVNVTQKFLDE